MPGRPLPDPRLVKARRALEEAVSYQQQGLLPQAEKAYAKVVAKFPDYFDALHFYGLFKYQQGQLGDALKLVAKATRINPRSVQAHNSLGVILGALGRHEDALAAFDSALALDRNHLPALSNRGNSSNALQRYQETINSSDRALAINPSHADAYIPRGAALLELRRPSDALESYERAIRLNPGLAVAWLGGGNVLLSLNRYDEARAAYQRALAAKPDSFDALSALADLLLAEGNVAEALDLARRALAAGDTPEARALVASCLSSPLVQPGARELRDLLLRALTEAWTHPSDLAVACVRFLTRDPVLQDGVARAVKSWPNRLTPEDMAGPSGLAAIAEDRLWRALLESVPVCDIGLERLAAGLRSVLLEAARTVADKPVMEPVLALYCALARQCFINNYVFAETDAKSDQARTLREAVAAALASGGDVSALQLAAVAAYAPLHTLAGAERLLERRWPNAVNDLLKAAGPRAARGAPFASVGAGALTADRRRRVGRGQKSIRGGPLSAVGQGRARGRDRKRSMRVHASDDFHWRRLSNWGKDGGVDVPGGGLRRRTATGRGGVPIQGERGSSPSTSALASLCYAQRQTAPWA